MTEPEIGPATVTGRSWMCFILPPWSTYLSALAKHSTLDNISASNNLIISFVVTAEIAVLGVGPIVSVSGRMERAPMKVFCGGDGGIGS
ncbi:hypothetical protein C8F04DRAFT_1171225 [Mycena alexandri]|uniref:Uncharacterized protein n=1 Tax=Mycena alexandri TaxID=1745969 RepID=A0AAD6RX05_9AGAR|nr:hypothetical protein C8F04DRAFT_1171225 [Mycena alexandri]